MSAVSDRRVVFVTGASGLVGSETVVRLRRLGYPVVILTHRAADVSDCAGSTSTATAFGDRRSELEFVRGDVRAPQFGLDANTVGALAGVVGNVVHCAASTDFAAPQSVYDELNVGGTTEAVALARAWNVPLVYVSTAYVCGRRDGQITETGSPDVAPAHEFNNGYERSKFVAEQNVRDSDGLRWSIVRPGIVTGYTESGLIRDHRNLYTIVKLIVEGKLRTLPGRYDATLTLAPIDHVADMIVAAVDRFAEAEGRTFHAVGDRALSLRDISDVFAEYPSFDVARFVPAASFDVDALGRVEREYYRRIGVQYVSYFNAARHFDTTEGRVLMGTPPPETGTDYLRVLLDACLNDGFLGAPSASIEEVVSCLR